MPRCTVKNTTPHRRCANAQPACQPSKHGWLKQQLLENTRRPGTHAHKQCLELFSSAGLSSRRVCVPALHIRLQSTKPERKDTQNLEKKKRKRKKHNVKRGKKKYNSRERKNTHTQKSSEPDSKRWPIILSRRTVHCARPYNRLAHV